MSSTTYCVEYAKSNRATCKACNIKIDKGAVRIGTSVPGPGDYDMTSWRHLACQKKKPSSLAELKGYQELKSSDQELVKSWFSGDMASVMAAKRKADEATAAAAADAAVSTPKKAKPTPTATTPTTTPKMAAASSSSSSVASPPLGLSAETEQRDDAKALFGKMAIADLKNCLRANAQILSGNKDELVGRCVDRKVYGNLPRCPECGIGKLKVTYPREFGHGGMGTFTCPGGYDDDAYVRCGFRASQVERPAWVVSEWETAAANAPAKSTGGKSKAAAKSMGGATSAPTSPAPPVKSAPKVAMPSDDD